MPSRLSPEEVARWRSGRAGVMAMVGHVPRLALGGRDRYGLAAAAAAEVGPPPRTASPDRSVAARRYLFMAILASAFTLLPKCFSLCAAFFGGFCNNPSMSVN